MVLTDSAFTQAATFLLPAMHELEMRLVPTPVQVELLLEVLLCADPVVVIRVWGEELPLALRTSS
jgi:hypothetical protein